jgi:acetolactate synthase I/II/III large subunit
VSAVFLVPTILSRTLVEMEQTPIKRIVTHGEKSAAYMADGYARATGRPGICMAQNVGAANLAAGLRDPFLGCSPVIAMTGGPYRWSRGRNYYQEIEDFPLFKPVTRSSRQVLHADRLPDLLDQAFRDATVGKPGPVHLELAGHTGDDVENATLDAELPEPSQRRAPGIRIAADPGLIRAAARALRDAERPVIVAGGGVRTSGASTEIVALAEWFDAPIATSLNGKDAVPGDHPLLVGIPGLYPRASANEVVLEADLVFYVGSQTGSQLTLNWQIPAPGTRIIHLDIDPHELGRHYDTEIKIVADAKLGLTALLAEIANEAPLERPAWVRRTRELAARWRSSVSAVIDEQHPLRPEWLADRLGGQLPENALVVSDTGHAGMWTAAHLDLAAGQGFIRAAGSLGWGLPAAIGAQLGRPDRRVVLFTGDGGLLYHLSELETAARWKVPVIVVVNDNHSLNQEINPYTVAYGGQLAGRHHELWHFQDLDLARVAESLGITGIRVAKASEFEPAMDRAISSDGPVLIDVVTDIDAVAPKGTTAPAGL